MIEPKRTEILDFIAERTELRLSTTQKDIAKGLGIHPPNVSRMMRRMEELNLVERIPNPESARNGTIYVVSNGLYRSALGWITITDSKAERVVEALDIIEAGTVKAGLLQQYLQAWASKRWEPKILKSYPALPLTIAGLFQAAVKLGRGERVSQTELSTMVSQLTQFRADLEQITKVVISIMNTPALQDPRQITEFLIPNESYIDPVDELVQRVVDFNINLDNDLTRDL